jgi:hypothetical protein
MIVNWLHGSWIGSGMKWISPSPDVCLDRGVGGSLKLCIENETEIHNSQQDTL